MGQGDCSGQQQDRMKKVNLLEITQLDKQIPKNTDDFSKYHMDFLNIKFESTADFLPDVQTVPPKEVLLSHLHGHVLSAGIAFGIGTAKEEVKILTPNEKMLASLLANIVDKNGIIGGRDSFMDTFVDKLLRMLQFDECPLFMKLRPLILFSIFHKDIYSTSDFSISRKGRMMIVNSDRHLKQASLHYGCAKYRLAGEMLASSAWNYFIKGGSVEDDTFAVTVISSKFTFFKTCPSEEYLTDVHQGYQPLESMVIYSYPPKQPGRLYAYLDYADPKEREEIVSVLLRIKARLLADASYNKNTMYSM